MLAAVMVGIDVGRSLVLKLKATLFQSLDDLLSMS
jgi:hypothetical protein|tara:strand:+ start:2640 stop:2744 length:105 start_codon:yes stop_codon:yes gene_type:complete